MSALASVPPPGEDPALARVLLVHNYYGSAAPSGENTVFELERALLQRRGHAVGEFVRHSDALRGQGALGLVRGAASTPWNPAAARDLVRAVDAFGPQVVHAHNTFPMISPAIFSAVSARAARVLTLHNYRLFCPAAIPLRDGKPCTECLDQRSALPALRHGCYRGSRLATLPLAANVALHRALGTWTRHVDAFIALTEFQRELMVASGLPAERVHVKPNFYAGTPEMVPWAGRREAVVFAGRLTEEKGVVHLVDAWLAWGEAAPELRIVGDGALRPALEARARGARIRFLGQQPSAAAEAEIARARLLVVPSVCFEGFPMVLREAFAFGTPVAVSDTGPLPGLVGGGRAGAVFRPADPGSLLAAVRTAWEAPGALERMSRSVRQEYEQRYAEESNYRALLQIYERAMAAHKERVRA